MTFRPKNAGEPVDAWHSSHSWDTATAQGRESTGAPPLPSSPAEKAPAAQTPESGDRNVGNAGWGGPARWGEEVGKGGLPSHRRQLALAVCLPVTFQKRNSEGTKGFFKITAPGWCGPRGFQVPCATPILM